MEDDWFPHRPWDVRKRGETLVVGSVDKRGDIVEVVCTFEYGEEVHKPIELTRARLLAMLVNACPEETWDQIKRQASDPNWPITLLCADCEWDDDEDIPF